MIRIMSRRVDKRTMVSVAGKLEESHLSELQEHCSAAETTIIFELTDLMSADGAAISWFCHRLTQGDEVLGASPYIKLVLEREQQSSDPLTTAGSRSDGEDN